ncbi:MAG: CPBP family glutamic-type intramembrane protease [Planctomycetaceae bacterium]
MSDATDPSTRVSIATFRDSTWSGGALLGGVLLLALWRLPVFVELPWQRELAQQPLWPWGAAVLFAPHVILLCYAFATRRPRGLRCLRLPRPGRIVREGLIAIPIVLLCVIGAAWIDYVLRSLAPSISIQPHYVTGLAASADASRVILLAVFAVLVAPLTEEVFFRGCLQNAFRARMPLAVAVVAQSALFGAAHVGAGGWWLGAPYAAATFVLGLLLTFLYEWRKTLAAPILAHTGMNFLAAAGMLAMMVEIADSPVLGVRCNDRNGACEVVEVFPDSAAELAGILPGDVVVAVDEWRTADYRELVDALRLYRPGDSVVVTFQRDGSHWATTAILRSREP